MQARIAEIQAQLRPLSAPNPVSARGFDEAFRAASARSGTLKPAVVKGPGRYGPVDAPDELAGFGNGRIPASALSPIGNGTDRLWTPAADAFRAMTTAAWQAGIDLKVNDSYRDLDHQRRLADDLGLYSQGGKAAAPGTSTHGWGLSVDLDTSDGSVAWLRANAARFGFVEDVPSEPWHWTYRPASTTA